MTSHHAPPAGLAPDAVAGPSARDAAAARGLTVYIVLLFALPSNLTIAGLGSYGRPSFLWGLALLAWWIIWHLQNGRATQQRNRDPVGAALLVFTSSLLVTFAAAMMRGQPADQISPAFSALLRLASWCGVVLVALEGLTCTEQVRRLVRLMVYIASGLALLGLAQAAAGQSLLNWLEQIPGVVIDTGDSVIARGGFTRAAGLSIHPLEHLTMLVGMLPFAIGLGVTPGYTRPARLRDAAWWLPAGIITLSCLVSISRSATIGLAVAFVVSLPMMTRRQRIVISAVGALGVLAVALALPGISKTVIELFTSGTTDSSTKSRTDALARVPEFMASSPLLGAGFGTFLPRYNIFDNQWVLLLVEVGILGTASFATLLVSGVWSANHSRKLFSDDRDRTLGGAAAASLIALAINYAMFDALSFPMSAGLLFLCLGLSAGLLRIATQHAATSPGIGAATAGRAQQD